MPNEYYERFKELTSKDTFKSHQWLGERGRLVEEYSWAIPNQEVLDYLSEFDHLYEVGAGNGYWAYCIEKSGDTYVTPFDKETQDDLWTEVIEVDVEDISDDLENNPVLMVWPPYQGKLADIVASSEPSDILYVGEMKGGCTGTDEFFDCMDEDYDLVEKIEIPSYNYVRDDFYHWRKI